MRVPPTSIRHSRGVGSCERFWTDVAKTYYTPNPNHLETRSTSAMEPTPSEQREEEVEEEVEKESEEVSDGCDESDQVGCMKWTSLFPVIVFRGDGGVG